MKLALYFNCHVFGNLFDGVRGEVRFIWTVNGAEIWEDNIVRMNLYFHKHVLWTVSELLLHLTVPFAVKPDYENEIIS
jgi:hypothetical protein